MKLKIDHINNFKKYDYPAMKDKNRHPLTGYPNFLKTVITNTLGCTVRKLKIKAKDPNIYQFLTLYPLLNLEKHIEILLQILLIKYTTMPDLDQIQQG